MSLPSASNLNLAAACAASQALPADGHSLLLGGDGTDRHDALARALVTGEVTDGDAWLDGVLEAVGDRLLHAVDEVAYSWEVSSGVVTLLGRRIGRHYPRPPKPALQGTVDYVVTEVLPDLSARVLAVDLKTGLGEVPKVGRNQQVRWGALAAARWAGATSAQAAILHAPRDGRRPWWEWGPVWDAMDLDVIEAEMRALVDRIAQARNDVATGVTPRLVTGDHCAYCPARRRCPAQVELVKRWAGQTDEAARDLNHLLDVETASRAWGVIAAVEARIREAKAQLYAFAATNPFPLPDGQMVGKHRVRGRDAVDVEKAWPRLVERVGVDAALKAFTLKASRTSLRDAIAATTPRGKKREAGDAFVRELEAAGVITERWTEDVGPYDPNDKNIQSASAPALADGSGASPPLESSVFSGPPDPDPTNGSDVDELTIPESHG